MSFGRFVDYSTFGAQQLSRVAFMKRMTYLPVVRIVHDIFVLSDRVFSYCCIASDLVPIGAIAMVCTCQRHSQISVTSDVLSH
eukprot:4887496-Amphidinium_carterae.1